MSEVGVEAEASKTQVHNLTINDPLSLSRVLEAIKGVKNNQIEYEKQVSEFMQNTNNIFKALYKPTSTTASWEHCWFHKSNNHAIQRGSTFANLSNDDKMQALRENNVCFSCLKPVYSSKNYQVKVFCEM